MCAIGNRINTASPLPPVPARAFSVHRADRGARSRHLSVATAFLIGAAAQLAKMIDGGPAHSVVAMNKAELVG
ncbi:hypothetical protein ABZ348_16255 [Streptomyces sp. NPDC005963]|uniref:hypothetical protein n=1 Tax=Streptomyces sp. NPDC005963 TaxID=3156721 RepID=UPI0033EE9BC5